MKNINIEELKNKFLNMGFTLTEYGFLESDNSKFNLLFLWNDFNYIITYIDKSRKYFSQDTLRLSTKCNEEDILYAIWQIIEGKDKKEIFRAVESRICKRAGGDDTEAFGNYTEVNNTRGKYKENLIRELANYECEKISELVIEYLKEESYEGLGDDSGLENTWEEFCVQVQGEESEIWDLYLTYILKLIENELEDVEEYIKIAIWLQTDEGEAWAETEITESIKFYDYKLAQYILDNHLAESAYLYTNSNITMFIDGFEDLSSYESETSLTYEDLLVDVAEPEEEQEDVEGEEKDTDDAVYYQYSLLEHELKLKEILKQIPYLYYDYTDDIVRKYSLYGSSVLTEKEIEEIRVIIKGKKLLCVIEQKTIIDNQNVTLINYVVDEIGYPPELYIYYDVNELSTNRKSEPKESFKFKVYCNNVTWGFVESGDIGLKQYRDTIIRVW